MDAAAQAQDRAVLRARDLELGGKPARVVRGEEMLAPVLDPFDRALQAARRERDEKILGIEFAAHAEAAADIVLDHQDVGRRQAHLARQIFAVQERRLARAGDFQRAGSVVPFREKPARLEHDRAVALHLEFLAAPVGRGGKGRVGIAHDGAQPPHLVALRRGDDERRPRERLVAVDDGRKMLDVERHGARAVLGRGGALGDHHRDRLAHIAHLVLGDDGLQEMDEARDLQMLGADGDDRDVADIGSGEDGDDARKRQRRARVDAAYAAARDRAAHDHGMQGARGRDVIDIDAAPGEEAEILAPRNGAADEGVAAPFALDAVCHAGAMLRQSASVIPIGQELC